MRIRTIKPEFWSDSKIVQLSLQARLLFIGLWQISDDWGISRANLTWIRSQLLPFDSIKAERVTKWVNELIKLNLIRPFNVNGENYFEIINFKKHQVVNRPSKFRYPSPKTLTEHSVSTHGVLTDGRVKEVGNRNKEVGGVVGGGEVNPLSSKENNQGKIPSSGQALVECPYCKKRYPRKDYTNHACV